MTGIDRTNIDVWQAWLALEHEAVWLYGVIGGRVGELTGAARDAWNRHRDTRDHLTALIRAAGAEPDGPAMGYPQAAISSETSAQAAAQAMEYKVATAALGCLDDESLRSEVISSLRGAAQAAAEWGAKPSAFPGLPVRATE